MLVTGLCVHGIRMFDIHDQWYRLCSEIYQSMHVYNTVVQLQLHWGKVELELTLSRRQCSLKYGKFQECTPVCVIQKAGLTSDQKQEALPILGSGMLFPLFPSRF